MKRTLLIMAFATLMTTFTTVAQESQSKLLTAEDVVLNRALSPKNFRFNGSVHLTVMQQQSTTQSSQPMPAQARVTP